MQHVLEMTGISAMCAPLRNGATVAQNEWFRIRLLLSAANMSVRSKEPVAAILT